jgi:hypothetical protein
MYEHWYRVRVVGPVKGGGLEVVDNRRPTRPRQYFITAATVPEEFRIQGAEFIVRTTPVTGPHSVYHVRFDPDGESWFMIRDRIRLVLNRSWDPMGCNGCIDDEYDGYVADLYAMLIHHRNAEDIADYLRMVETDKMSRAPSPVDRRLSAAHELMALDLPIVAV